jgi:membrane protein
MSPRRTLKTIRFLRELLHRMVRHGLGAESARVAYYSFLGLFPVILILFALTGLIGGDAAFHWIMHQLEAALPGEAAEFLGRYVLEVTGSFRPGALSIGVVLMIWSSSHVYGVLSHALNVIFGLRESRRWWRRRGLGLVFQVAGLTTIVVVSAVMLVGPGLFEAFGISGPWAGLRWPVIGILLVSAIWAIFAYLPNWESGRSKRRILLGALVAAGLWALATGAFRLYVANFGRYNKIYGFVGAAIILQIWFYMSSMTILIGAEVAALLGATRAREEELRSHHARSDSSRPSAAAMSRR